MNFQKKSKMAASLLASLLLAACGRSEPATTTDPAEQAWEENHAAEVVKLTPEQIANAGIQFAVAGPASIRETLPLYGAIVPNAERVRDVTARYPGTIRTVNKKTGDSVRQGEVLATVESNESLQTYSVVAPQVGVVTRRNANPGEQTDDKVLFTVADLSTVWVELSLFPRDLAKVKVGQAVRVKVSDSSQIGEGQIVYVAPFGSAANQTLTARALLDNPNGQWAPGLYVTAEITLSNSEISLAIRKEAVQSLKERNVVFVADADELVAAPVRLGRSDGEYSEVIAGIAPGTRYATKNSYIVKAELGKGEAAHED